MKTIVVFSGGMDSTVLLAQMLMEGHEVRALSVNYGQRHNRELIAAVNIARHFGVEHQIADMRELAKFLSGSSQTSPDVAVPHGHYAEESMKKTVVPNRNMLLLAIAGAWAISTKSDSITYGAHAGDHAIYPDCRPEFADAMNRALLLSDWHSVHINRPFIKMTKAGICKTGAILQAPLHLSYSCYEGREKHCGKCGTCVERKEAFQLAGVTDPTTYEDMH